MTYENFLKVTLSLQKEGRVISELYKLNVDLIEFVDLYHKIISTLIEEIYGKHGLEMFDWFCYHNDFGQKGYEAFDGCGNIICDSHESLWAYLESIRKEICFETSNSKDEK
jgi:hypothetical protein